MLSFVHPAGGLDQGGSLPKTHKKADRHRGDGNCRNRPKRLLRQREQFVNRENNQPQCGATKKPVPEAAPGALPTPAACCFFKGALDDLDFAHGPALRCDSNNSLASEKLLLHLI